MATEKNITMKQFNGRDYDTLYPKTIASQIPDVYSKSYIDSILKNNARIQTGSYVGTGTYGANNPCTLTFDFNPHYFTLIGQTSNSSTDIGNYPWGSSSNGVYGMCLFLLDSTYRETGGIGQNPYYSYGKYSNNTYSWYYTENANGQFNGNGNTYYWIAIG